MPAVGLPMPQRRWADHLAAQSRPPCACPLVHLSGQAGCHLEHFDRETARCFRGGSLNCRRRLEKKVSCLYFKPGSIRKCQGRGPSLQSQPVSVSARRGIFFGLGRKRPLASTCGLEARSSSASGRRRDRTISGHMARVIPGRILRVGGVRSWLLFAHLLGCEGCLRILPRGFPVILL